MSYTEYHDTLSKFVRLRVRPSTLPAFGFHSEDGFGWLYTVPIDGTPLECHVSISAKGVVSERVLDSESGDEYTLYRVANANGRFVGLVRKAVTSLLKRLAASCFERNVFIQNQSRELLETVRSQWGEELEFLWEDSPESAVLRRADTGKWYAVMMRLPKRKFGLADDSISEFILLRIPNEKKRYNSRRQTFPVCLPYEQADVVRYSAGRAYEDYGNSTPGRMFTRSGSQKVISRVKTTAQPIFFLQDQQRQSAAHQDFSGNGNSYDVFPQCLLSRSEMQKN